MSLFKRVLKLLLNGNWQWLAGRIKVKFQSRGMHPSAAQYVRALGVRPAPVPDRWRNGSRIIFISHSLELEGASLSLFELVCALQKEKSFCPVVIAFEAGPLLGYYKALGIAVRIVPVRFEEITTQRLLDQKTEGLSEVIKRESPDLVFANTLASFPAVMAAYQSGVPSVWNIREGVCGESFFWTLPFGIAQQAIACIARTNKVIFVSQASRRAWMEYENPERFEVIPNALNPERLEGFFPLKNRVAARREMDIGEKSVVFLSVGMVTPRKAQHDLVDAFMALPKPLKAQAELVFVGPFENQYAQKLMRRCARSLDHKRIKFAGSCDKIWPFYSIAHVFVLNSRSESYPRVILEAMAAGLPVLTTPVDGIVEQVREHENAFFFGPSDRQALSKLMEKMITHDELRMSMGNRSRDLFRLLPVFDSMVEAYCTTIKGLRSGGRSSHVDK